MEYWRWWVVHLWVEGFFEVFATVVIAFLFARLGLRLDPRWQRRRSFRRRSSSRGGIIGTFHHLYFSGTPTSVLALGADLQRARGRAAGAWSASRPGRTSGSRAAGAWIRQYRWPIYFFVAVAFWNLVGAGLFGFLINPPIALYYMQGLNTTPVHGHAALFGVYGMLGIGLHALLSCVALRPGLALEKLVRWRCVSGDQHRPRRSWSLVSVLPIGFLQTLGEPSSMAPGTLAPPHSCRRGPC